MPPPHLSELFEGDDGEDDEMDKVEVDDIDDASEEDDFIEYGVRSDRGRIGSDQVGRE